jgi:triacylglycerol lipase
MNLVFASGFLFPQKILGVAYFRGLQEAFPGACFPAVPPNGSIEVRANALVQAVTRFGFPDPGAPIHIIAHSMGGLDARYALHKNISELAGRVASLSTIATPHHGSPIADFLVGAAPGVLDIRRVVYETLRQVAADLGIEAGALGNLTTDYAVKFNSEHPDIAGIPCYCYAGNGTESYLIKPLHLYIQHRGQNEEAKANDGLVSVASASWKPLAEDPWPTDHLGEVGHNLNPPTFIPTFGHIEAFRRVVQRAERG